MTNEQIVEAAKSAEKKTEFGELVHSKVSRGVNSAYGIGFLEVAEWARGQLKPSRFHPGDWVVYDGPLGHAILQIKDVVGGRYSFVDNESTLLVEDSDKFLRPLTPKDVERPAEWSDDIIRKAVKEVGLTQHQIDWFKTNVFPHKQEWSEEDEMKREGIIQWLREYQKKFNPKDDSLSIESINSLIDWIKSLPLSRPKSSDNWKPNEDEERLINISISFLKDFADKGYENVVECIDWLKSKLNGNSCK